jgi:hypothetical protein
MLQKIRTLPQGIKLALACVICLSFGILVVGLVKWLS